MNTDYVQIGKIKIPVKINRRARRIILRPGPKGIVLVIPSKRHLKDAVHFANQRQQWIEENHPPNLEHGDSIGLWTYKSHEGRLSIELDHIDKNIWHNPSFSGQSSLMRLRKLLAPELTERTEHWAHHANSAHKLSKISIHNFSSKWGSCDSNGHIKLTVKLGLLAPELRDYVIAHEITHLDHQNHSSQFWSSLEQLIPDAKQRRKSLKSMTPKITLPSL